VTAPLRYAYYPGCSLHSTAREYDTSTRAVARALGLSLEEVPDWTCCGASSAHVTDPFLGFALPARTLAQASDMGLDLVAPCAACYGRLVAARAEAGRHPDFVKRFERATGRRPAFSGRILNVIELFAEPAVAATLKERVKRPLEGLKVAPYYGCLLVRPPKVTGFDDPERPVAMDRLLESLGATPVDFAFKTECCGASLGISRKELVVELAGRILRAAKRAGAEAVAVVCPLCHTNLDGRQEAAAASHGEPLGLPVYYVTELVGLALGLEPAALGLGKHLTDALGLLRQKKLA